MARDTGTDIKLISLSNYIRPQIIESRSDDWVLNGRKNWFYQYIIDRKNGSATNSAIINSYVDLIYGKGIGAKNAAMRVEDWLKLKQILKPKTLHRIVSDFALFGEASFEIIENKGRGLAEINHVPKQKLVPNIANEDNEIEVYWYSNNWAKIGQNKPEAFKAFNGESNAQSMYVIQPYSAGKDYFADPPYLSGMPYAEMEEEIANLNINSIKNGLSAGYIINIPDGKSLSSEEKQEFENKIKQRLTGSTNASQFIISFNGRDVEVTITPFPVNDNIHKQWQFLTSEARQQLLTAHRVVSPMLFGIKDSTGLGNNANELEVAEAQLMKRVVAPMQNHITTAIEEVLEAYDINLDLYFIPLAEIKTQLSSDTCSHIGLSNDGPSEEMATALIEFGEDLEEENWLLLSSAEVDYDTDDDLYSLINFATSTGVARPNSNSEQDSKDIAIRYRYVGNPTPERMFCKKMIFANKLYRKEDILQMNKSGVNDGFGLNGTDSYSIWLWKGGGKMSAAYPNGTCKHKWNREIYLKRGGGVDVNSPLAKTISTSEARRKGYKVPTNNSDVSIAPHKNK
jgi:hypothetical protein